MGSSPRGIRSGAGTWLDLDVRETYSHVAAEVEQQLMVTTQKRWIDAIIDLGGHETSDWRIAA